MPKYIAILRGINVGGKHKILMPDLKTLFSELDIQDFTTYIQSGNLLFSSPKEIDCLDLAEKMEKLIFKQYGFEVPIIIITTHELENAIACNPFTLQGDYDINKLYLAFLKSDYSQENLAVIQTYDFSPDRFIVIGRFVYICYNTKAIESKITTNFIESKLKVVTSSRNWKTVLMLTKLANK